MRDVVKCIGILMNLKTNALNLTICNFTLFSYDLREQVNIRETRFPKLMQTD